MPAIYGKDTTTFDLPGFQFRPLVVPSKGSTELAIWQLEIAPNADSDRHSVDREEVFVVTGGRLLFEVEGSSHALEAGDAMAILPGQVFKLSNPNGANANALVCTRKGIQATMNGATITPPWSV